MLGSAVKTADCKQRIDKPQTGVDIADTDMASGKWTEQSDCLNIFTGRHAGNQTDRMGLPKAVLTRLGRALAVEMEAGK